MNDGMVAATAHSGRDCGGGTARREFSVEEILTHLDPNGSGQISVEMLEAFAKSVSLPMKVLTKKHEGVEVQGKGGGWVVAKKTNSVHSSQMKSDGANANSLAAQFPYDDYGMQKKPAAVLNERSPTVPFNVAQLKENSIHAESSKYRKAAVVNELISPAPFNVAQKKVSLGESFAVVNELSTPVPFNIDQMQAEFGYDYGYYNQKKPAAVTSASAAAAMLPPPPSGLKLI